MFGDFTQCTPIWPKTSSLGDVPFSSRCAASFHECHSGEHMYPMPTRDLAARFPRFPGDDFGRFELKYLLIAERGSKLWLKDVLIEKKTNRRRDHLNHMLSA
jgi:hypothetical protein